MSQSVASKSLRLFTAYLHRLSYNSVLKPSVVCYLQVELYWHPKAYHNVISNKHMVSLFTDNAESLGVEFCTDERVHTASGSTDMGNVSQVVPSIHPMFYIGSTAVNHTRQFTDASGDLFFCSFCGVFLNE